MATLGNTYTALADQYRAQDSRGVVADIITLASHTNSMLEDAVTVECNQTNTHESIIMSGYPESTWTRLYEGVAPSKSKRVKVKDTCGMMEQRSVVDARMEEVVGKDKMNAYRLQEAGGHIEAMANDMGRAIIYESQDANPERITGLAPRFNELNAVNGHQIIDAGGTGSDNTSVWLIDWSPRGCHFIYPKGSSVGIKREMDNDVHLADDNGNTYKAHIDNFRWHNGLVVRDWRKVVRIANIDVSELEAGNVDLYKFMRKAYYRMHGIRKADVGTKAPGQSSGLDFNLTMGRTGIYANADILEALDGLATKEDKVRLIPREVEGKEVETYRGVVVRQMDAILNNEARVV